MPQLKLFYFDIPGKAEGIRWACAVGGVEFEDVRFSSFEDFAKKRQSGELPFGQVPAMAVDGKIIAQSSAIIRFVGKCSKIPLYPTDPFEAAVVDSIIDQESDMTKALDISIYQERFGFETALGGRAGEGTALVRKTLNDAILPRHLESFEKLLEKSTSGWIAGGNTPTIADFVLVPRLQWLAAGKYDGISTEILQPFPKLCGLIEHVLQLPEVRAWNAAHPEK